MPGVLICATGDLAQALRSSPVWRNGIEHNVASSPDEARRYFGSKPTLVVIDRDLPGAEALVKETRNALRCSIAIVARGDQESSELGMLSAGANAVLRYPPDEEWDDRLARLIQVPARKQVRIHVELDCEGIFGTETVPGRVVNLSRTGMLLECGGALGLGDEMKFRLMLNQSTTLNGSARIVRLAGHRLFGCEFVEMDSYDLRRLEFFLQQPG